MEFTYSMKRILVIGATGNIGRQLIAQLVRTGAPVRAMTRKPDRARMPTQVEVVGGDLTLPDTLKQCLINVDSVFLVWTAPQNAAEAALELIAKYARVLSSSFRQLPPAAGASGASGGATLKCPILICPTRSSSMEGNPFTFPMTYWLVMIGELDPSTPALGSRNNNGEFPPLGFENAFSRPSVNRT